MSTNFNLLHSIQQETLQSILLEMVEHLDQIASEILVDDLQDQMLLKSHTEEHEHTYFSCLFPLQYS